MANNENLIPIPGRLHSVATEGHVAGADEIYDDTQSKLQSAINADVAEDISDLQEIVGEGSVDTRIENAVKALDAEKSQTAGADGLALSVTEVDGKITSISGSIATDTYDSYGSASAAQEAAATDATTKVNAAKAELLGDAATDYNTLGKLEDAIQSEASTRETEIGTDSTAGSVKGRIKSLETLVGSTDVDSQIDAKINALDSTKSQTAGADGLALSIEEEDGKIKSISGSIAANTYDAYGAASTAKSDLLGDAASDYNTLGKLEDAIQAEATTRSGETEALDERLDNIEDVIPSAASSSNQLADKSFVNSSISTATAEFQGSYNSVSDLELTTSATHAQIATALGTEISGADNNDYCFVQIPTADATPTDIAKVERYKYDGTAWNFEYELNNSGYTDAQWAAINSGITSNLVTAFGNKYDKPSTGIPSTDMTEAVQTSLSKADTALQEHQDISGKQDVIDSTHKLAADLVDDTTSTNKFTNATEKQTWNAKQDALTFNTTPSANNKVATMADIEDATENCAYLGDDDGSAIVPSFDPETDTLHKAAQVLTTAQKDQVAENLNNRGTANGMGRVVLKASDDFKTVVESYTGGNVVFVIQYNYTLSANTTIPANCVLEFDGGSISGNYALSLNRCLLKGTPKLYCLLSGNTINDVVYASWFGMKGDGVTDDTDAIQKAIDILLGQTLILDSKGDIYIAGTINCAGGSQQHRIIKGNYGTDYTRIVTDNNYGENTPIFNISSSEWTFEGVFLKNIGNNKKGVGFKTQGRCQDITIRKCYIEGLNVGYQYKDGSCYNLFDQNVTYYCNKGIEIVNDGSTWCGALNVQSCKFNGCTYGCYLDGNCSSTIFNDTLFEADTYKLYSNHNKVDAKFVNCYWGDESKECIIINNGVVTIDGGLSPIGGAYTSEYNPEDPTFESNTIIVNGGVLSLKNIDVHSAGSRPNQNGSCIKISGGQVFTDNVSYTSRNVYQYGLRVVDCNNSERTQYLQRVKSFIKNGIFADSEPIFVSEASSDIGGTITKTNVDNGYGGYAIRVSKNSKSNIGIKVPYSVPCVGRYMLRLKYKLTINNDVLEPSIIVNTTAGSVIDNSDKTGMFYNVTKAWYGLTNLTNRINNTDFIYETGIPVDISDLEGFIWFTLGQITTAPQNSSVDIYYIGLVDSNSDVVIGRLENNRLEYKGSIRPTINLHAGDSMFDTSINKPIYWNGTAWVDATGTTV